MPATSVEAFLCELAAASAGSYVLSRQTFVILGGEIREESTSRQGGVTQVLYFWPGAKDPCLDWQLTTSLNDIVHYVDRNSDDWTLVRLESGRYAATIHARRMFVAATPALAMCGALVWHRHEADPRLACAPVPSGVGVAPP